MEEGGLDLTAIDITGIYPRGKIGAERPTLNRAIYLLSSNFSKISPRVFCGNASLSELARREVMIDSIEGLRGQNSA